MYLDVTVVVFTLLFWWKNVQAAAKTVTVMYMYLNTIRFFRRLLVF